MNVTVELKVPHMVSQWRNSNFLQHTSFWLKCEKLRCHETNKTSHQYRQYHAQEYMGSHDLSIFWGLYMDNRGNPLKKSFKNKFWTLKGRKYFPVEQVMNFKKNHKISMNRLIALNCVNTQSYTQVVLSIQHGKVQTQPHTSDYNN